MRRVVLLALLALAVPTVALADGFDFGGNQALSLTSSLGGLKTGTILSATTNLSSVNGVGTGISGNIVVTTGAIASEACPTGITGSCFGFSGGNVSVTGSAIFSDSLTGGLVVKNGNTLTITASLMGPGISGSSNVSVNFKLNKNGTFTVSSGSSDITGTTTPEPGTLGLLGTGLIGLAGVVRRKLRA